MVDDVHVPVPRAGFSHDKLHGYHRHGMREALLKAHDMMSENGTLDRVKLRYRPKEIIGYHVQSDHIEGGDDRYRRSRSGWLVPGPGGAVFYVPEQEFNQFFEIIDEDF
jgi:hypothetical protein